jgi:uncharacterized protein YuzE
MKVISDYDEHADVLYLTFDDAEPAICYELEEKFRSAILVRYNPATDRVSGITILNLKDIKPKDEHENFGFF